MGGNCQLCCKNDDEELVGARVGGQQRKHIGSRAAAFPDCSSVLASANPSQAEALPGWTQLPVPCPVPYGSGVAPVDVKQQNAKWP